MTPLTIAILGFVLTGAVETLKKVGINSPKLSAVIISVTFGVAYAITYSAFSPEQLATIGTNISLVIGISTTAYDYLLKNFKNF